MKTTILYEKRYLYRGWLCRPLSVFYVTVFPSFCGTLGRVANITYPQLKTQFKGEKHIAKTKSLQGLKTAGSPRHPFRPIAPLRSARARGSRTAQGALVQNRTFGRRVFTLPYLSEMLSLLKCKLVSSQSYGAERILSIKDQASVNAPAAPSPMDSVAPQLYINGFRPPSRRLAV